MTDAIFSLNALYGADFLATGIEPHAGAETVNGGGFYDYYESADRRYMYVGSVEPQFFDRLCLTLGGQKLLPQGRNEAGTVQFKHSLESIFKQKPLAAWEVIFADIDAYVEPVISLADVCAHPQIKDRFMIVSVPLSGGTQINQIGHPIKMSRSQPTYRHAGVKLGEHNVQVLDEMDVDDSLRKSLIASGGIARRG